MQTQMKMGAANEQLRRERQRRGWSRAYIAEQIGVADPKTIGRWERGGAFPSAYFLQKLCELFQMPAEELGLWQKESQQHLFVGHASSYFTQRNHLQFLPETTLCDPALPPAQAGSLVGREKLLEQLRLRLCAGKSCAISALSGLPGVGKTALAIELAHNSDLQRHFSDGVLWASLGPLADIQGELRRWGELLEIEESGITHQERTEDWTLAIHARIGARKMLLIIDDAWTEQEALAFQIGGSNCAYLLTTRIPAVALSFASTGTSIVDELGEEKGLELLARFVPEIVSHETIEACELVHLAGGLPLALQLMGRHLQTQVYSGQPRRWRAALEMLKHAETRLQLSMPRAPLERQVGLLANTSISLQNAIEPSYRWLEPASRQALVALASLPARTGSFSEEAALALSGVTLESLDNLLDAGLLASTGLGQYTLHQTLVDFARLQEEIERSGEMSSQVRTLRQLRDKKASTRENRSHPVCPQEEILPAIPS